MNCPPDDFSCNLKVNLATSEPEALNYFKSDRHS